VALSALVHEAVAAAEELAGRGVSVEVIDPRTLNPLDLDSIVASIKKTQHLVVAHDAHKRGGVGAEIAALAMEEAFDYLDAPVERVCGLDVPVPSGPLLTEVYPTAGDIVAAVERSLQRSA
jgi:pyruvate dehydrogenase E1 component beta subunit